MLHDRNCRLSKFYHKIWNFRRFLKARIHQIMHYNQNIDATTATFWQRECKHIEKYARLWHLICDQWNRLSRKSWPPDGKCTAKVIFSSEKKKTSFKISFVPGCPDEMNDQLWMVSGEGDRDYVNEILPLFDHSERKWSKWPLIRLFWPQWSSPMNYISQIERHFLKSFWTKMTILQLLKKRTRKHWKKF
jgi:hypothetical protein